MTFALILKSVGRIYGLDMGKDHKNPNGDRIGKKHKHSWSVEYRDKKAYVPTDITASILDPVTLWEQFCEEACIEHNGRLNQIPPRQEELFQREIGKSCTCEDQGDYQRIHTPFLYPDGDCIDLYCRMDDDKITITDLAETTRWLRSQTTVQKRSPKQRALIADI